MKRILSIIAAAVAAINISAQETELQNTIQMAVYFDEGQTSIPQTSKNLLEARIKTLLSRNTLCAAEDFAQFFVTCEANQLSTDILPGAPTKYRNEIEVSFYVIDAFAKKMFASEAVTVRGIGNSQNQSYTECFKQINASNKVLNDFFTSSAKKILSYYDSQYQRIISQAQSLASVKEYEQALMLLAAVPVACVGYDSVNASAVEIYQKYLDHQAAALYAKANAIWSAGQNSEAAYAVADLLAEISPDSKYWNDAQKLLADIRATVKDNIAFERKIIELEHKEKSQMIQSWKEVGVAYGTNQKSNTYHNAYLVR